ncbi:MAG: pilus assembly protein [Planctomycetaceae bacterium]|nr:pilus assembly protein [Planctomycetaceae bacterium]
MKLIQKKQHKSRNALMSMELAMTLPLLMLVLFAVFEYSLLFYARGGVVQASRIGARSASYPGSTVQFVEESVTRALGPRMSQHANIYTEQGQFSGDRVVVVVKVPMSAVSPDLLWPIGFGLHGRYLVAETYMEME